jgi:hypothetical protein
MPLIEQELFILPEHISSLYPFVGFVLLKYPNNSKDFGSKEATWHILDSQNRPWSPCLRETDLVKINCIIKEL